MWLYLWLGLARAEPDEPPGVPYYDTSSFSVSVPPPTLARARLKRELRQAGLTLWIEDGLGALSPIKPSSSALSDAVISSLFVPVLLERRGAEMDMVAEVTETHLTLVTARWEMDGRLVLSRARSDRGLVRPGPPEDELRRRWGFGPLVADGRPIDPLMLGLLDEALGLLDEMERATVAGLAFHRCREPLDVPTEEDGRRAAAYIGDEDARMEVYDRAFLPKTTFVGEPSAPRPFSLMVLEHELGHAVAWAPARAGRLARAKLQRAIDVDREAFDALGGEPSRAAEAAALVERIERNIRTIEAIDALLTGDNPVLAAWSEAVGDEPPPTLYGRKDLGEAFAEAFALFHVDRRALERVAPRAAAWLARGGHTAAAEAALADLSALLEE